MPSSSLLQAVSVCPCTSQSPPTTHLDPSLNPRPDPRPYQQSCSDPQEDEHDGLVFGRVALEARREHIVLLRALADGQIIVEAELAIAVRTSACSFRCTMTWIGGGVLRDTKRDDSAVGETGAFAKGCWCCWD